MAAIETTVLYKDNEKVVVNADSEQEAKLIAEGWSYMPVIVSEAPKPKAKAKAKAAPKRKG